MDRSWVAVRSIQLPRCEPRRSSGILRWTSVFVAALLCALAFVATAQAEDRAPPAPDGAPLSSDSTPNDGASATPPDPAAATGTSGGTDASAVTDASAAATDTLAAQDTSATAIDPSDTPGAATDTAASTTEATDTLGEKPIRGRRRRQS